MSGWSCATAVWWTDEVRVHDGAARNTSVVAAVAVLFRLHRDRSRRHRGDAVAHSERARRVRAGGEGSDCRRRVDLDDPPMDGGGAAGDRKPSGWSRRARANGKHRDADDGAARGSGPEYGAHGGAASRGGRVPPIRHGSPPRRAAVLTCNAER